MPMPPPERPLHILALSRALPFHGIGGMQAIAWDIFRELVRFGHRVTVITTAIAGKPEHFVGDGVHVVQLPAAPAEKYGHAWWRDADRQALAVHRQAPIDAVFSVSAAAAHMTRFRRAAPAVRFLFQAHGTSWGEFESKWRSGKPLQWLKSVKNLYWLFKDARVYRRFDEIIMVGDVLEQQFRAWPMPWVAGRVPRCLIRNGIDTHLFRPNPDSGAAMRKQLGIPPEGKVFIFVARLHPQKGGFQLLRAFDILAAENPKVHLLIVGGGEDEHSLRAQAASRPWRSSIIFTGAVSRPDIPAYLASADVFVFPSLRTEVGLPMNVLEALACGLPSVISESMGSPFPKQSTLLLANPDSPSNLSRAMNTALTLDRSPVSLLDNSYTLEACAQAYSERLFKRQG